MNGPLCIRKVELAKKTLHSTVLWFIIILGTVRNRPDFYVSFLGNIHDLKVNPFSSRFFVFVFLLLRSYDVRSITGRGQPWRGGGRGAKRPVGSDTADATSAAAVAAGGAIEQPSSAVKARRTASHASKKAKVGEAKVLWSSAGKEVVGKDGSGSSGSSRIGGGDAKNSAPQNLSSLAGSFRERFGEDVIELDTDGDAENSGDAGGIRKSSFEGGAASTAAEEMARSMSPAKLAAEVQRARARAREERFGGCGFNSSSSPAPSSSPAKKLAAVEGAAELSSETTAKARVPGVVFGTGGREEPDIGEVARKRKMNPVPIPPQPLIKLSAASAAKATTGAVAVNAASALGGDVAPRVTTQARGLVVGVDVISPLTTRSERPPSSLSPTPTSSTPASALALVAAVDGDGYSAARAPPRGPTERTGVPAVEAMSVDETASTSAAALAASNPESQAQEREVALPPKKARTSPPPLSLEEGAGTVAGLAPGKVHTLRLRSRADVVAVDGASPKPSRVFDGGVEESKGFEPPNLPPTNKSNVETGKEFGPQNQPAPLTAAHQERSPRSLAVEPDAAVDVPVDLTSDPSASQPLSQVAVAVDTMKTAAPPAPRSAPLVRPTSKSWGPSFGISSGGGGEEAQRTPPAVAALLPPAASPAASNPWMLSSSAPTFAKNIGRPLARSFSRPTSGSSTSGSSATGRSASGIGESGGVSSQRVRKGTDGGRPAVASGGRHSGDDCGGGGGGRDESCVRASSAAEPRAESGLASRRREQRQQETAATVDAGAAPLLAGQVKIFRRREGAMDVGEGDQNAAADAITGAVALGVAALSGAVGESTALVAEDSQEEAVRELRVGGGLAELLARLKREREESIDFERKLTQALLDL